MGASDNPGKDVIFLGTDTRRRMMSGLLFSHIYKSALGRADFVPWWWAMCAVCQVADVADTFRSKILYNDFFSNVIACVQKWI